MKKNLFDDLPHDCMCEITNNLWSTKDFYKFTGLSKDTKEIEKKNYCAFHILFYYLKDPNKPLIYVRQLKIRHLGFQNPEIIVNTYFQNCNTLCIYKTRIGANTLSSLSNSSIEFLGLSNNFFEIEILAKELPNLKISSLSISENDISDGALVVIANVLSKTKLRTLNLRDNNIGNYGANYILCRLSNITSLNLSYNKITSDGAKLIVSELPNTNLNSLYLRGVRIGEDEAKAIADILQSTKLTILDLKKSDLGRDGMFLIIDASTKLTFLDLSFTQPRYYAKRINIPESSKLRHLKLCGNNLTFLDIVGITKVQHQTKRKIDVRRNYINNKEKETLHEANKAITFRFY